MTGSPSEERGKWFLTVAIVCGLVLGVVVGQLLYDPNFRVTMSDAEHAHPVALGLLTFVGNTVFLGLLKMLILPLIATSVIMGVTSVGDFRELGRVGGLTILYYVATMAIAASIGLVLVSAIEPGAAIQQDQLATAQETFAAKQSVQANIARGPSGVLGALRNLAEQIIPRNLAQAAAEGKSLPIIFFCILFGVVLTTLGEKARAILVLNEALFHAIMKLVQWVIWLTPLGVFALLAWTVARIGLGTFTEAIGGYMLTVAAGLAVHGLVVLPAICWLFTRQNPFAFMHQMRQALMTAFGTDSSSATLPVTMECATDEAGISERSASFVLPLGSTINMDGTALYEAVAVVFLAQAFGVDLGFTQLVLVAITATLAAVGAAGIPSAGLVTMVIVINAVNSSLQGMG
ncbi:MAG: dicarboxylate/amino acid:cation symporter, partial [Planctomycetota bacterium]